MIKRTLAPTGLAAAALTAGFAIAGCITTVARPATQPPTGEGAPVLVQEPGGEGGAGRSPGERPAPGGLVTGDYACEIQSGEYRYPPFRCVLFTTEDGTLFLEKLGGSQRFRGRVFPDDGGFSFEGTFFCPWGACTRSVEAAFQRQPDGSYRGDLRAADDPAAGLDTVTLRHTPGGFAYGGVGYGGVAYGGAVYGGAGYARPPLMRRR